MLDDSDMFEASKKGPALSFRKMKPLEPYNGAIAELVRGAGHTFERMTRNAPYPFDGWFVVIHRLCYANVRSPRNLVSGRCPSRDWGIERNQP